MKRVLVALSACLVACLCTGLARAVPIGHTLAMAVTHLMVRFPSRSLISVGLPTNIDVNEGSSFNSVIGNFTDSDGNTGPSPDSTTYSVSINWNDGSPIDTTSGSATWSGGSMPSWQVVGTHSYPDVSASVTPTVTITDSDGSTLVTNNTKFIVHDASLVNSGATTNINYTEGIVASNQTVAQFSDPGADDPSEYQATVNWGDGSQSDGTVSGPISGGYFVNGSHTYAEAGSYSISVTILDLDGSASLTTNNTSAVVSDAPLTYNTTDIIDVLEGASSTVALGDFTDANPSARLSDFSATIDWGDGSATDNASITQPGGVGTPFLIGGTHTYAEESSADHPGSYPNYSVTVSISDVDGATVLGNEHVLVTDQAVSVTGDRVLTGVEGTAVTGTVATFTDPAGLESTDDYSAMINWGDGTPPDNTGTISLTASTFTLSGSHTYAEAGAYPIGVTVSHEGAIALATSVAAITDAALTPTNGSDFRATEGADTGFVVIGSFADANPIAPLYDFSATIAWGDGNTSPGSVIQPGGVGTSFLVEGSHTYLEEGSFTATATLTDSDGSSASATASATVQDPVVVLSTVTFNCIEGESATGSVATFMDPGGDEDVSEYSATIDWGDGSASDTGTISVADTTFTVSGTHTYTNDGSYTITVTVNHDTADPASIDSDAEVSDQPFTLASVAISGTEGIDTGSVSVATFADPNTDDTADAFSSSIDWGDGSPLDGGTVSGSSADGYTVTGHHRYAEDGSYSVTVTVDEPEGTAVSSSTGSANIADADLTVTGQDISPTENLTYIGVVASFTDANPVPDIKDFSASVNWGDGSTPDTSAIISSFVEDDGTTTFLVNDIHTYCKDGTFTVSTTVNDIGGASATNSSAATVIDPLISPILPAKTIHGLEGINTGSKVLGLFNDADPFADCGDYYVSIDWGDGSDADTTTGSVVAESSVFGVTGCHAYAEVGTYTVTVTVTDTGDKTKVTGSTPHRLTVGPLPTPTGQSITLTATAVVDDAPLVAGAPKTPTGTAGASFTGVVACFDDGNPAAPLSDFTTCVDWGDGSPIDKSAVVSQPGGVGTSFNVTGTHTYASISTPTIRVTINDVDGSNLVICNVGAFGPDTTKPTVAITVPGAGSNPVLAGGASVSGTAGDNVGVASVTLLLYRPAMSGQTGGYYDWTGGSFHIGYNASTDEKVVTGTTSWSQALPPIAGGIYQVRATAKDAAGNSAGTAFRQFTVDTTKPTVIITKPRAGANSTLPISATVTGTSSDNTSVASVTLLLYRPAMNGQTGGYYNWSSGSFHTVYSASTDEKLVHGTSSWSLMLPASLAGAIYQVRAMAKDTAGNSAVTAFSQFTIDAAPPTVAVAISRTAVNTIKGTASDNIGVASVTLLVYRPHVGPTAAGFYNWTTMSFDPTYNSATDERVCTGTTNWSRPLPPIGSGTYQVRATAKDTAGNSTSSPLVQFTVDTTAPTAAITTPANNANLTMVSSATGTASDDNTVAKVTLALRRFANGVVTSGYYNWAGGTWDAPYVAANDEGLCTGTTAWSKGLPALPAGQYLLRATVTDGAGNTAVSTNTVFTIH